MKNLKSRDLSFELVALLLLTSCTSGFQDKIEVVDKDQKTYLISTLKNNVELYHIVKDNKLCPGMYTTESKDVGMIANGEPVDGRLTYNIYAIKCLKE